MSKSFYTAWAEVAPDFSKFGREVDKGFKDSLVPAGKKGGEDAGEGMKGGMLGAVAKIAGPLAAAFAAINIGSMVANTIKDGIAQASDLEQSVGAIQTVFKAGAADMLQWSDQAATSVGLTKNEFNELGTLIGTQLKNGGTAMDQLAPKTNDLIELGADLSSMFGGSTRDAVEALSSALKGERDPIERYGVSLTQAAIDAKAAELGFTKVGGALSTEANQAATLALIMDQTADAHGNFTKESDTLAHQQQVLAAGWDNIVTQIGGLFLPMMTTVVGFLNSSVIPAISGFFTALQSGQLGPFGTVLQALGTAFSPVIDAIVQLLPILLQLWGLVSPVGLAFRLLQPLLPLIADLLNQIAAVVGGVLSQVLAMVMPLIQELADLLTAALAPILPIIGDLLTAILVPAFALISAVIDALMPIIAGLLTILQGVIDFVTGVFTGNWDQARAGIQKIFDGFVQTIQGVIDGTLKVLFQDIPNFIRDVFSGVGDWLVKAGTDLIMGFVNGIKNSLSFVGDAMNGVMNFIGGFFPHSPADRGPFAGAGWTSVGKSGQALYEQFVSGFGGDGPDMPALLPPRIVKPAPLDEFDRHGGGDPSSSGDVINFNGITTHATAEELAERIETKKRRRVYATGAGVQAGVS